MKTDLDAGWFDVPPGGSTVGAAVGATGASTLKLLVARSAVSLELSGTVGALNSAWFSKSQAHHHDLP